ncbi:YopX family protein [Streptococcus constellatus]|uniref:YopX family protein n=1 Tax=Streptococcus constellatus TaxID=76860 RepID=UPI00241D7A10|nr:YopX family protein [Streptococcus constellatus]
MIPKFRAWDKKSKQIKNVEAINLSSRQVVLSEKALLEMGGMWSVCDMPTLLDDVILMQSTGLFDKNGVEIFEGDVVGMRKHILANQHYYEVFKHRGGTFRLRNKFYGCELWLRHEHCEVLGNIYENPELMEVEE